MEPVILEKKAAVGHLVTLLRDRNTATPAFAPAVDAVATLIIARALEHAPAEEITVETPLEECAGRRISERDVICVPILRAGMGMERAFARLLPFAPIYHIGMKRDEVTFEPDYYYDSLPKDLSGKSVFIVDPMLATGGSAVAAARRIAALEPEKMIFCGIIGAPEGLSRLREAFPEMPVYLGAMDSHLDETAYIRPGLGDAGDRIYGTE